jgi:CDGSH-type Zn-finger protein
MRKERQAEPLKFEMTEKKKVLLCTCGKTKNPPFCVGRHKK